MKIITLFRIVVVTLVSVPNFIVIASFSPIQFLVNEENQENYGVVITKEASICGGQNDLLWTVSFKKNFENTPFLEANLFLFKEENEVFSGMLALKKRSSDIGIKKDLNEDTAVVDFCADDKQLSDIQLVLSYGSGINIGAYLLVDLK